MKKRYLVMFTALMVVGLSISIYQYAQTMKTEFANAAVTKPANGHSWTEMESDADSIQVSGQTITNLAVPVNPTDAVNKAYADTASGGGTYSACYILSAASSGVTCAAGYTSILHHYGSSTPWVIDSVNGATNALAYMITVGGSLLKVSVSYCYNTYNQTDCTTTWQTSSSGILVPGGWTYAGVNPAISFGEGIKDMARTQILANAAQTLALCCK